MKINKLTRINSLFIVLVLSSQSCVAMQQTYGLAHSLQKATSHVSQKLYNFFTNTKTLAALALLASVYVTYPSLITLFTRPQAPQRPPQKAKERKEEAAAQKISLAGIDLTEKYTLKTEKGIVHEARYSSDGSHIIIAGPGNIASLYNANTGIRHNTILHSQNVTNAFFGNQKGITKTIATLCRERQVFIMEMPPYHGELSPTTALHRSSEDLIDRISFSADDTLIAAITNKNLCIWDSKTGIEKIFTHKKGYTAFAWHPKESALVVGSEDGMITTIKKEINDLRIMQSFQAHTKGITSLSFGSLGDKIVSASEDNTVCLWKLPFYQRLAVLQGHTARINNAYLSPHEEKIISTSNDRTARIWDSTTGRQLHLLKDEDFVRDVHFNQDGSLALTTSIETACIWDTATDNKPYVIPCTRAHFSPNGTELVTVKPEEGVSTVKVWDIKKIQQQ